MHVCAYVPIPVTAGSSFVFCLSTIVTACAVVDCISPSLSPRLQSCSAEAKRQQQRVPLVESTVHTPRCLPTCRFCYVLTVKPPISPMALGFFLSAPQKIEEMFSYSYKTVKISDER